MATVYKRGKTWWLRFRWRGQEIRRSCHTTSKGDAQEALSAALRDAKRVDRGGKPRTTFEQAIERFVASYLPKIRQSSSARYLSSIAALNTQFEDLYLDEINQTKLGAFVASRRVSDATIRRDLACLSSIFTRAKGWGMIDANPLDDYDRKGLKDAERRTVFLSRKQFAELHQSLPASLKDLALIAVGTGMRLGEILALRWADIDYERMEISIRDSKTGLPRQVPMSVPVSARFRAQPVGSLGGFVFARPGGRPLDLPMVSRAFGKAAGDAGMAHIRFHDLRHTFASWAVQAGADLHRVGKILGHKGPQMTQRYAHLRTEDLHSVIESVGTNLGAVPRQSKREKPIKQRRNKT